MVSPARAILLLALVGGSCSDSSDAAGTDAGIPVDSGDASAADAVSPSIDAGPTSDPCEELDATRCSNGAIERCVEASGSPEWQLESPCADEFCFDSATCGIRTDYAVDVASGGGMANAIESDADHAYVAGDIFAGSVFAKKLGADGTSAWEVTWSSNSYPSAQAVAVAADGSVFVAGQTSGAFEGYTSAGGEDAFVTKLDADGGILWTAQWGTSDDDEVASIALDDSGNIYVGGQEWPSQVGFATKLDAAGTVDWTYAWQDDEGYTEATAISAGPTGGVYVAAAASVRRLDVNGDVDWACDATVGGDALAVDVAGAAYVSSLTRVVKLDAACDEVWSQGKSGPCWGREIKLLGAGQVREVGASFSAACLNLFTDAGQRLDGATWELAEGVGEIRINDATIVRDAVFLAGRLDPSDVSSTPALIRLTPAPAE